MGSQSSVRSCSLQKELCCYLAASCLPSASRQNALATTIPGCLLLCIKSTLECVRFCMVCNLDRRCRVPHAIETMRSLSVDNDRIHERCTAGVMPWETFHAKVTNTVRVTFACRSLAGSEHASNQRYATYVLEVFSRIKSVDTSEVSTALIAYMRIGKQASFLGRKDMTMQLIGAARRWVDIQVSSGSICPTNRIAEELETSQRRG